MSLATHADLSVTCPLSCDGTSGGVTGVHSRVMAQVVVTGALLFVISACQTRALAARGSAAL